MGRFLRLNRHVNDINTFSARFAEEGRYIPCAASTASGEFWIYVRFVLSDWIKLRFLVYEHTLSSIYMYTLTAWVMMIMLEFILVIMGET